MELGMSSRLRSALVLGAALLVLRGGVPAGAAPPYDPGQPIPAYVPWSYPPQLPWGGIEDGRSGYRADPGAGFLTLPFTGPHYVTSLFDHCRPDYVPDGRVCRFDGQEGRAGLGTDPQFARGYAVTRGGTDFLYYDGHDGLDYGLFDEPVLAAAPGVVAAAGWFTPGCTGCEFGQQVVIDHGNGFSTRYGHLSEVLAHRGQAVSRGQVIGVSGDTGATSGPHLHFGVYLTRGMIPVDPYGWAGKGADPWPHDQGDLWLGGSPRYPDHAAPAVTVTAHPGPADPSRIVVTWSSPVPGTTFEVSVVEGGGPAVAWLTGVGAGSAIYGGVPGRSFWFLVDDRDPLGWTATGASPLVLVPRFRLSGPGGAA
ncbi:MAG: M23 family metallopeptidase [Candidatus Dormibacteraceae bacterium]